MKICELQFSCTQRWDDLDATDNASARYCSQCRKAVFMVKTKDALNLASALGRCVGIADDNDFIGVIGEAKFDWMEPGFFEGVSIKLAKPVDESRLASLRLQFPKLFDDGPTEQKLLHGGSAVINDLGPGSRELLRIELQAQVPEAIVTPNPLSEA